MERIERIQRMEKMLDELTEYYQSPLWMQDFDADRAGELPQDLKRGVLSEDAVWDLLTDHARLTSSNRLERAHFKRLFSLTMRRSKRFALARMTFDKDFVNEPRGNLYPVLERDGVFEEQVRGGRYTFRGDGDASVTRFFGRYFPYATYELVLENLDGQCGFVFSLSDVQARILFAREGNQLVCACGEERLAADFAQRVLVCCRREHFDIYADSAYMGAFTVTGFEDAAQYARFSRGSAALCACGGAVTVSDAGMYMDCGIAQADMRPVQYEDGSIMVENGKVYLTMTVRMQQEQYQGVFSWVPGTCEFEMVGALFFDAGDGLWGNDVASALKYHRPSGQWYLWICSFTHGHVLAHAAFDGDVRFGLNVVDITLMPPMTGEDDTAFLGKEGDEDPDFVYDAKNDCWLMTICRSVGGDYRYFLFASKHPFEGYTHVAHAQSGAETGGSIIPLDGQYYFVCGNDFHLRANYRLYTLPNLEKCTTLYADHDDGGFRGWGTILPIRRGSRTKLYWLTFDRHRASDYNWSYGSLYGFEAE